MKTEITYTGNESASPLGARVRNALRRAIEGDSKVSPELLSILGMSGQRYRRFINNLVESTPDARYLEVGSWAGSTLCSAIYKNKVRALAIDNWSQFEGPQGAFFANLSAFVGKEAAVSFFNSDFRAVPYGALGKFNIYLFDGPHEYQDQYDGLALAKEALDDEIVFIVDDWNWPKVRAGTRDAIRDAGWSLVYSVEIRSTDNDRHPAEQGMEQGAQSDWHNGYFIGVLRR